MEIVTQKPWEYTLYKKSDVFVFSVVCGTVAVFDLNILLNKEETESYIITGNAYLSILAANIRSNPEKWKKRAIDLKTI